MKIIFKIFLIAFILLPSSIFAQSAEINGRVVDKSGGALAGVNVYLEGTVLGSASDETGVFQISRVPEGMFILKFSMVGYQQEDTTLIIKAGIMIEIGEIVLTEISGGCTMALPDCTSLNMSSGGNSKKTITFKFLISSGGGQF